MKSNGKETNVFVVVQTRILVQSNNSNGSDINRVQAGITSAANSAPVVSHAGEGHGKVIFIPLQLGPVPFDRVVNRLLLSLGPLPTSTTSYGTTACTSAFHAAAISSAR